MDATKWTQGFQEMMTVKPMEQMASNNSNTTTTRAGNNNSYTVLERKTRPQEKLNCPRCNSTNTKFCYYNNYSLAQPRYFCKGCRRYWTEGGSLRNVPVGGSSRKNRRSSSSSSSSSSLPSSSSPRSSLNISSLGLTNKLPDPNPPILFSDQNPKTQNGSSPDLNLLSVPAVLLDNHSNMSQFLEIPNINQPNPSRLYASSSPGSSLQLLRTGVASRGLNNFMPGPIFDPNTMFSSGFSLMQDHKPSSLSFTSGNQMKQIPSTDDEEANHNQQKSQGNSNNGYWSEMFSTGRPSW